MRTSELCDSLAKNILAGLDAFLRTRPDGLPDNLATPESQGSLLGVWTSHPISGVVIETMLDPDGHFVWNYKEGNQTRSFSGTYILQGGSLIFTRLDGRTMDGVITVNGGNRFWFRLKTHQSSNPGLIFSREFEGMTGLGRTGSARSPRGWTSAWVIGSRGRKTPMHARTLLCVP